MSGNQYALHREFTVANWCKLHSRYFTAVSMPFIQNTDFYLTFSKAFTIQYIIIIFSSAVNGSSSHYIRFSSSLYLFHYMAEWCGQINSRWTQNSPPVLPCLPASLYLQSFIWWHHHHVDWLGVSFSSCVMNRKQDLKILQQTRYCQDYNIQQLAGSFDKAILVSLRILTYRPTFKCDLYPRPYLSQTFVIY